MDLSDIAQKYIEAGFSILPTNKDKSPAVLKWRGVTFTPKDFINAEGIGIMCGDASGGLECGDFDNHFGDAKENLSKFLNAGDVKEIYEKYNLPVCSTQSGGFHLLFRSEYPSGNKKLASRPKLDKKSQKWKPDAIIETRGEGGYFVAAPTNGYKVVRNDIYHIQEISKEERNTLIETAISFNQWFEPVRTEYESDNRPGDVYNEKPEAISEMKSALLGAGWKEVGNYNWRRPNKKKGISATIGKVADNVFYNFSANGHPFDQESGYTPFQVVCLLQKNGDFKSFAKELSDRYNLSSYDNTKPVHQKKERKKRTDKELGELLVKSFVDVNIPVEKPPVILEINHGSKIYPDFKRLMTLGNISSVTGKGKSKKTFLQALILSSLAINGDVDKKFRGTLPSSKRQILQFDTEQGEYDTYIVAKKIHDLSGGYKEHFGTFNLREYEPYERLDLIERAINHYKDHLGFILIDGVADLVSDINDIEQSINITTVLMQWSKKYNIHISTVIHQNKNDNYATGHLGSSLIKKSELVIGVEKDEVNKMRSIVTCQNIRGAQDFDDFAFVLNDKILPEVDWDFKIKSGYV